MRNFENLYDFRAFGYAIKAARKARGWTREKLAQTVDLAPRYIMSIENKGQHPSFQVFYELVTLFNISVDQFFFPDDGAEKSTRRRQLDGLSENDLIIMQATAKGIRTAKNAETED
jgi:transcriptional regulator with XRE-family HTH domain